MRQMNFVYRILYYAEDWKLSEERLLLLLLVHGRGVDRRDAAATPNSNPRGEKARVQ